MSRIPDLRPCRRSFPSLSRSVNGQPAVYIDNPGGTQVPQQVIDGIVAYLQESNAMDFLICSSYKFFGLHVGILYGKQKHLERIPVYKARPASNKAPNRWETGTRNHECLGDSRISGTLGQRTAQLVS